MIDNNTTIETRVKTYIAEKWQPQDIQGGDWIYEFSDGQLMPALVEFAKREIEIFREVVIADIRKEYCHELAGNENDQAYNRGLNDAIAVLQK